MKDLNFFPPGNEYLQFIPGNIEPSFGSSICIYKIDIRV